MTVAVALADALVYGSVQVVTNVPGFGGSQVFDTLAARRQPPPPISYHEEVALGVAHGASLLGTRAAVLLKAHGLAKAANAVVDALAAGTTAALLLIVFDDPNGEHSDSVLGGEGLARGLGLRVRTPRPAAVAAEVFESIAWSERWRLPVAIVVPAGSLDERADAVSETIRAAPPSYSRDVHQHLVCPLLAPYQHRVLEAKQREDDWRAVARPALPQVPADLPERWRVLAARYEPAMAALARFRPDIVTGDTGLSSLFACPPYEVVDVCTYMGGSLPLAIGARLASRAAWAVTGDFSFVAAGHLGLAEVVSRGLPFTVVVFDNRCAGATGGQRVAPGVLEAVLGGYRPFVRTVHDHTDSSTLERTFAEARAASDLRIIIVQAGA